MQAISLELRDRSDHIETVRYVPSLVDEKRPIQVVEGSGVLQEAPSRCTFPKWESNSRKEICDARNEGEK